MEPFEYPEDRGELFGEPNEEEAWVHFALMDFQTMVSKYGIQFVISRMNHETFEKLSQWFYEDNQTTSPCYLLKKKC